MVAMDSTKRRTREQLSDETWRALAGSTGFSVESPIGPLGTVEAVRYSGQPGRPQLLVVRVGEGDGQKIVLVPASSIEEVLPEKRRILLRPGILFRRPGGTARGRSSTAARKKPGSAECARESSRRADRAHAGAGR
jgi:hypothetical protein